MIITNDLIKEATIQPQSNIGNRLALDAANPSSNVGSNQFWYDLSGNFNRAQLDYVTSFDGFFRFVQADGITSNPNIVATTFSYGNIVDSKSTDIAGWEITTEIWFNVEGLYGYNQNNAGNDDPSVWPHRLNLNTQPLFGKFIGGQGQGSNYSLILFDSFFRFQHTTTGGTVVNHDVNYNTIGNLPGNWAQIVYKQDSAGWTMILNGDNIIGSGSDTSILVPDNQPLFVGKNDAGQIYGTYPYAFYGDMSVVNLWDRALTDAEIKNNYNFYIQRYI